MARRTLDISLWRRSKMSVSPIRTSVDGTIGCFVDCAFPAKMPRTPVPARKDSPKKQKESRERFTADEIVCAIEAVGKAGLTVYSVEITLNGSININTTSPPNRSGSKPQLKANQDPADKDSRVVSRK